MLSRIALTMAFLGILSFCLFGFLASFEPSPASRWGWRVPYSIIGLSCVLAVVWLWKPVRRGRSRHQDNR